MTSILPLSPYWFMKKAILDPLAFFLVFSSRGIARGLEKRRRQKNMIEEEQQHSSLKLTLMSGFQAIDVEWTVELPQGSPLLVRQNQEELKLWIAQKLKLLESQMKRDPAGIILWSKNHRPSGATVIRRGQK